MTEPSSAFLSLLHGSDVQASPSASTLKKLPVQSGDVGSAMHTADLSQSASTSRISPQKRTMFVPYTALHPIYVFFFFSLLSITHSHIDPSHLPYSLQSPVEVPRLPRMNLLKRSKTLNKKLRYATFPLICHQWCSSSLSIVQIHSFFVIY